MPEKARQIAAPVELERALYRLSRSCFSPVCPLQTCSATSRERISQVLRSYHLRRALVLQSKHHSQIKADMLSCIAVRSGVARKDEFYTSVALWREVCK